MSTTEVKAHVAAILMRAEIERLRAALESAEKALEDRIACLRDWRSYFPDDGSMARVEEELTFLTEALAALRSSAPAEGKGDYVMVPREPTDRMKQAAFGSVLIGGRSGPVSADFIRQEAALSVYRAMIEAAAPTTTTED